MLAKHDRQLDACSGKQMLRIWPLGAFDRFGPLIGSATCLSRKEWTAVTGAVSAQIGRMDAWRPASGERSIRSLISSRDAHVAQLKAMCQSGHSALVFSAPLCCVPKVTFVHVVLSYKLCDSDFI